eukprot:TRINITY_DN659_c0_g1_i1.p4 TRINITY_DN659_c0_g1~~TRINITY_DN659_c0_g1_i1.p4  ORF type:complete len:110 (-),score=5.07 TRINITY_DN659_c0_g1_i1:71-400(-)
MGIVVVVSKGGRVVVKIATNPLRHECCKEAIGVEMHPLPPPLRDTSTMRRVTLRAHKLGKNPLEEARKARTGAPGVQRRVVLLLVGNGLEQEELEALAALRELASRRSP